MYYGQWDFYGDFSDRSSEDWGEGYIVDAFSYDNMMLLKDLIEIVSPSLVSKISYYKETQPRRVGNEDTRLLTDFLSSLEMEDDIVEAHVNAQVAATTEACVEGIKKTYCDPFYDLGIENYSRYCFRTYRLDWGSAVLLFARFGTEEDKLLDLIFNETDNNSRNHLPEYYEMAYNYWDRESFDDVFYPRVNEIIENKISEVSDSESYNPKYFKTIGVITQLGGFNRWIDSKDRKFRVKISDVDSKTSKITYSITSSGGTWGYNAKTAKSDLKTLLNYLNQGQLFDPTEYRS